MTDRKDRCSWQLFIDALWGGTLLFGQMELWLNAMFAKFLEALCCKQTLFVEMTVEVKHLFYFFDGYVFHDRESRAI